METKIKQLTHQERENFESYMNNIINHPFLHYHPYLLEDEIIIKDAEKRAECFEKFPKSIIDYLNQCCCVCYIGSLRAEENPYTDEGIIVEYKTLPVSFDGNEISINKSDFNPRKYLNVCGFANFSSFISINTFCEKYTIENKTNVKICSLVNDEAEIERYQNKRAFMAYSIPSMSDYGSLRMAYRFYTIENNSAEIIRKQILRTQQYILCSIINFPKFIKLNGDIFDEAIYVKYLPQLKQMYDNICVEMNTLQIESNIKKEYIPIFCKDLENYLSIEDYQDILSDDIINNLKESYEISDYNGMFTIIALNDYDDPYNFGKQSLIDRNGHIFKPRFRNYIECIENSNTYINVKYDYEIAKMNCPGFIICYADDIDYSNWEEENYSILDDDEFAEYNDFYNDNDKFYYDKEEESKELKQYYLGLINLYGQTVFEIRSLTSLENKFHFKKYDNDYIIICLSGTYDMQKGCYTKCGAIDVKKGCVVIPLIYSEDEIKNELSHIWAYKDNRYFHKSWYSSFYFEGSRFGGPIYRKDSDILEQGKYAGHTIKDALYYYGKEILFELIFEDKIFIADSVFPNNIAHLTSIERSVKLHQDKHLIFEEILDIDDTISTQNGFDDGTRFKSLYEGLTLKEAICECPGMFYIKSLVENGNIKIAEKVIDELINEDYEKFSPLKKAQAYYFANLKEY